MLAVTDVVIVPVTSVPVSVVVPVAEVLDVPLDDDCCSVGMRSFPSDLVTGIMLF